MDFTEGVYDSADYPDGLYIYEIGAITDDPPDHILIEGIFRYAIQEPDGEGMIACFETRDSFRRTRSVFLDESEYVIFEQRASQMTTIRALEGLGSVD